MLWSMRVAVCTMDIMMSDCLVDHLPMRDPDMFVELQDMDLFLQKVPMIS